ncbi:MAG: GNAT family N-acetyltransferase [Acidimicrobiales bacterium]
MSPERSPWPADVTLSDGGVVRIRSIRPDDAGALVRFHLRLSPETIYYRFFAAKPRLTDREVERFVTVDGVERAALVAELGEEIVAVGRFDRWTGTDEAEVAFVVDDAHQGRGLGSLLLEQLVALARDVGITRFTAETLPDNRAMLSTFTRAGFEVRSRFEGGVVELSFDIIPTDAFREALERREQRADARSVARFLRPRSIAVIGASDRPGSIGRALLRNLLTGGFDGPVYPVNPLAAHVASVPAYASVTDVPDDVHLAVVAVPADEVAGVLADCAAKAVRGVVVVTAVADPDALAAFARGHGMRLVGPSSLGLVATDGASTVRATFSPAPVRAGGVGISLQSGPLGTALLEELHRVGLGVSSFVSLGDKADVSANDLLNFWADDPATAVCLLYTESFGNPAKFARVARRVSAAKPIVAVRTGDADRLVTDALHAQAGVSRVDTVAELVDLGRLFATQPLPAGARVAVIANASGPVSLVRAAAAAAGLSVVASRPLPLDAGAGDYAAALDPSALADADTAVVLYTPALGSASATDAVADAIEDAAVRWGRTVVAVALGRPDGPLRPGGAVPTYRFPEPAVAALGRAARYAAWRTRPVSAPVELDAAGLGAVRAAVDHALSIRPGGTLLPLRIVGEVLGAVGLPWAPSVAVVSLDAALAAAESVGYPVALKAAGRQGRTERSGIALDVGSPAELRASWSRMEAALGMAEAVVQAMVPTGVEVAIDVRAHPSFGPVVAFGLGGLYAEFLGDRPARSLPLGVLDAEELLRSARVHDALVRAGADLAGLRSMLATVGALADAVDEIDRLVLDPILVSPSGAVAVDATIHVAPVSPSRDVPLRRIGAQT